MKSYSSIGIAGHCPKTLKSLPTRVNKGKIAIHFYGKSEPLDRKGPIEQEPEYDYKITNYDRRMVAFAKRIDMGIEFTNHRGVGPVKRAMWWLIKKESAWMKSMGYQSTLFTGNLYWIMNALETVFWMIFGSPSLLKATEHLNLDKEGERHIHREHFKDKPIKPLSGLDTLFLNTIFRWRKPFNHQKALLDIGVALNIIG